LSGEPRGQRASQWVAFWDRREPATSLAIARILVGVAIAGDMLPAVQQGLAEALFVPLPIGMGTGRSPFPGFLPAPTAEQPEVAAFYFALVIVPALTFALGAFHRASGIFLTLGLINLARFNPYGDAIDTLYRIAVPILTMSRADARYSIDAWVRKKLGKTLPSDVPAWPRYLMVLQLVWMYFSAAHGRSGAAWWPHGGFAAIGDVTGDPHFARFRPGSLASVYPLTQVATAISMLFEMSAPLMLLWTALRTEGGGSFGAFSRRLHLRWVWLAIGSSLHLGIALTMKLGMFPFGVLALYPLFVHPDEFLALFRALARRPSVG
jgi:hypothetical protein